LRDSLQMKKILAFNYEVHMLIVYGKIKTCQKMSKYAQCKHGSKSWRSQRFWFAIHRWG